MGLMRSWACRAAEGKAFARTKYPAATGYIRIRPFQSMQTPLDNKCYRSTLDMRFCNQISNNSDIFKVHETYKLHESEMLENV